MRITWTLGLGSAGLGFSNTRLAHQSLGTGSRLLVQDGVGVDRRTGLPSTREMFRFSLLRRHPHTAASMIRTGLWDVL